jgi:hypothetical protein
MKTILTILIIAFSFAAQAQRETIQQPDREVINQPTKTATVKDTTFKDDTRLTWMTQVILPAIAQNLGEEMARQRVAGEVTFERETQTLFDEIVAAVNKFANNFMEINAMQVDPTEIEKEFMELNTRIEQLQNDPDIKYIEAVREFQNIKERQARLSRQYQQIETKEKQR